MLCKIYHDFFRDLDFSKTEIKQTWIFSRPSLVSESQIISLCIGIFLGWFSMVVLSQLFSISPACPAGTNKSLIMSYQCQNSLKLRNKI